MHPALSRRGCCAALALLLLAACQAPQHRAHHTLLDAPGRALPEAALLLPVEIQMFEISAGGVVEEVPEWTEKATAHVQASIDARVDARRAAGTNIFDVQELPDLPPPDLDIIKEHLALYDLVAGQALALTRSVNWKDESWQHKLDHFDYSIGPGLAFLARRTGVSIGIIVTGVSAVPTTGRVVMGYLLGGVQTVTYLHVGVVDLETGDLLWVNDGGIVSLYDSSTSFASREDVDRYIEAIIEPYPGLDELRALRTPAGKSTGTSTR